MIRARVFLQRSQAILLALVKRVVLRSNQWPPRTAVIGMIFQTERRYVAASYVTLRWSPELIWPVYVFFRWRRLVNAFFSPFNIRRPSSRCLGDASFKGSISAVCSHFFDFTLTHACWQMNCFGGSTSDKLINICWTPPLAPRVLHKT